MILRTNLWLLAQLLLLATLLQPQVEAKDEDYSGGDVSAGGGGDDIYDPVQQEAAVEDEEQRNSLEAEDNSLQSNQTDNALPDVTTEKPLALLTTEAPASTERDENTAAEVMEDAPTQKQEAKMQKPRKQSQEYYYDEEQPQEEQPMATTTTVPEYVRKAKAERYPQDYMQDAAAEQPVEQQTQPAQHEEEEEIIYHDEPQQPQAHMQQLPTANKAKAFKPSSDEYYYDEQLDQVAATTPRISTTESPPMPVLQSRFGGFIGWPTLTPNNAPLPTIVAPAAPTTTTSTTTTSTSTSTTTTTTTTTPAPRKQSKHIHLAKPELLPADQLRNYIKDVYIRMPLAVIVDPSAASLEHAKRLYIDALQDKNINIKIVLVTLNASGLPSAFSFNNTREFIAGLNSTKEHEGGDAFVGVLQAAELVPYDSAIFISTACIPPHTELVQDTAITLLKKRIRLFMLWYGEHAASENETEEAVGGILGEVAIRSGGEIIHIVSTEHGQHIAGNTLTLVSDEYQGSQELELPVDTTLSSLHVRIDAGMRRATLATPNGG